MPQTQVGGLSSGLSDSAEPLLPPPAHPLTGAGKPGLFPLPLALPGTLGRALELLLLPLGLAVPLQNPAGPL